MLNDMRYRIQFQKKKPGGRLPVEGNDSWETVIECWAKAEGLKGREYYLCGGHTKRKNSSIYNPAPGRYQ
nr:head-tail adaptor protein [Bacillus velezensis]WGD99332.1 head-tail adaptor protein [Bacillus velezensis]